MKNRSLKKTFLGIIIYAILIFFGVGTFIFYYIDYRKNLKIFEANLYKMINNTYSVYQNYLWILDYKNLFRLSNSLLTTNLSICEIKILDESNKVIYDNFNRSKYCNNKNILKIDKKIYHKKIYLGKVSFFVSKNYLKENLNKFFIVNLLFSILLSLIVLLLIIAIFNRFLNKPLSEIIESLRKVTKGEYDVSFSKTGFEEFDEITENLNKMLSEIKSRDLKNKELTKRLNDLVNNIPEGFIILDEFGNYVDINDSFAKMLKMEKKEVLSKKIPDLSSKNYTMEKGFQILNNIKSSGYEEFEWEIIDKDGNIIPVFVKGKKILLGRDNLIIFTITDISYIKKLEKEVLTKEKLESIGILAGGIAHDFNNILTSISGGIEISQLFIERKNYDNAIKNLKRVVKSIDRAKFLTHQLLTFSKGGAPVKKPFFDLKELIKDTVEFILTGSSIKVTYDFDTELHPVKIDSEQISLVIQNIILNAKQAISGSGLIEVKAVNDLDYVKISIKDYGKGISKEIMDKIWEPYFTTKKSGSGLGLSIVYSIIKNHNGDIKVYSEEGKFTEFQIFIPALSKSEKESIRNNKIINEKNMPTNLKILVMDDDKEVQKIYKDLLEILGHSVDIAINGEEAIEKYSKSNYDLVFLDLTVVGGIGGKDCISKLREINKDVKAVVCSGYSNDQVMTNYNEYGFKGVLKKPFNLEKLKQVILECFK